MLIMVVTPKILAHGLLSLVPVALLLKMISDVQKPLFLLSNIRPQNCIQNFEIQELLRVFNYIGSAFFFLD